MEKLIDEQIIKALEICSDKLITSCPDDCPFYDECEKDLYVLKRQALDLINRKDAEIERLKEELDGETVKNMRLGHEVERLKAEIRKTDNALAKLDRPLIEVKSEAYKEFAERFKWYVTLAESKPTTRLSYSSQGIVNMVDFVCKELTEGGNEDG